MEEKNCDSLRRKMLQAIIEELHSNEKNLPDIVNKLSLLNIVQSEKWAYWLRSKVPRGEEMHTIYACSCCNDYVGFKSENDIGIKIFADNYKYCRSCGSRMLGVIKFAAKIK